MICPRSSSGSCGKLLRESTHERRAICRVSGQRTRGKRYLTRGEGAVPHLCRRSAGCETHPYGPWAVTDGVCGVARDQCKNPAELGAGTTDARGPGAHLAAGSLPASRDSLGGGAIYRPTRSGGSRETKQDRGSCIK